MSEERRQILQMLAEGTVTADEAGRLLDALGASVAAGPAKTPSGIQDTLPKHLPRYLRVMVDDMEGTDGPTRVNVRVPLKLLQAGVRLASLLPEVARDPINQALTKQGIPFDVSQLKPADLEALVEHLADLSVDVDQNEGKVKVRIFAE
jgi:hypothetical protein